MDVLAEVGGQAAAVIAIGSCASWEAFRLPIPIPLAPVCVADLLPNKTIINLPGCPPNPYTLLGWCCSMPIPARYRKWTREKRPKFAYDRDIHETVRSAALRCRPFCEAIRTKDIAKAGGLYEMVARGPDTHPDARPGTSTDPDVWPIGTRRGSL